MVNVVRVDFTSIVALCVTGLIVCVFINAFFGQLQPKASFEGLVAPCGGYYIDRSRIVVINPTEIGCGLSYPLEAINYADRIFATFHSPEDVIFARSDALYQILVTLFIGFVLIMSCIILYRIVA